MPEAGRLFAEEDLNLALLGWMPDSPYDGSDPEDFPAFSAWFTHAFTPVYAELSSFLPDNWSLVRERLRLVGQTQYWLAGVVALAEAYLIAAEASATYIVEQDLGGFNKTEKLKDRQKSLCIPERTLVTLIRALIESLKSDVGRLQTELRQFETEARLGGLEK